MSRQDDEKYFGDVVYEAWRRGRDPDAISRDRASNYQYDDYTPEEAVSDYYKDRPKEDSDAQ